MAKLEQALGALQRGHDCIKPVVLANEVTQVLARLGFAGWRPEIGRPVVVVPSGPCGQFPGTDTQPSDPYLALDPSRKVVMIGGGPPLSTVRAIDIVEPRLITDSGARCLSLAAARTLTRRLLAPSHISAKFAATAELLGEQFNATRQLRYNAGCVVVVTVTPTTAGQTVDVWLNRSSPCSQPE